MNEVELLALGDALARTSEVLCPGECLAFRNYLERVLRSEAQLAAGFGGDETFVVSVDGRPGHSRVVLYRRQGPALDVLTRVVVRRICLN
jgi:hypothetical protein